MRILNIVGVRFFVNILDIVKIQELAILTS